MSTNNKIQDLPLASRKRSSLNISETQTKTKDGLTEGQKTKVIDGTFQTLNDGVSIARTLIEGSARINEIRESGHQEVQRIEAETRQIEVKISGMIDVLIQNRKTIESKGTIAIQIINDITRTVNTLPVADEKSRQTALEILPRLVELALHSK